MPSSTAQWKIVNNTMGNRQQHSGKSPIAQWKIVNNTMENRQQRNGKSSTTQWKVLKNKSDCPLQLLKNFLQTTSEHHNFIFYQKYINEALKTSR